jgi:hypothetical protein
MKATRRLAQNAIQLPAVLGTEVDVGEAAVLGECEVGGVCVGEAAGLVVALGFGEGEALAVGEAAELGADGFWLWARLALVSKRLIKKALEAKTRL